MMRFGVFVKWFFQIPPSMAVIIAIKASSSSAAVVLLYEISCIFLSPFYAFSFGKKNKSKKTRLKKLWKKFHFRKKKWRILIVVTFFFPILTFLDFSSSCRSLENMFYFSFLQMVEMDGRDGASERKPWMAREFSCPFQIFFRVTMTSSTLIFHLFSKVFFTHFLYAVNFFYFAIFLFKGVSPSNGKHF